MDNSFSFEEAQAPEPTPEPAGFTFEEVQQPQPKEEAGFTFEEAQDQSVFRQVADIPLKTGAGVVAGIRAVADVFGAGSETSKALKGAEDWISQYFSAQSRQDAEEMGRLMEEAKQDPTTLGTIKKALEAASTAPGDLIAYSLGAAAPAILTAIGTTLFGAPAAIGTTATMGVGALMGAGTVKGAIYDAVEEELKKTDMPKKQIEARAKLAQEYGGKNLDLILSGAAIGALSSFKGLEGSALRSAAARVAGKTATAETIEAAAKQKAAAEVAEVAARGPVRQGVRVGFQEAATEFPQESYESAVAPNVALQREGYDVPTFYGALAAGTMGAAVGAPLGGGFGAREAIVARQEQAKLSDINELIGALKTDPELEPEQQITAQAEKLQASLPKPVADQLATRIAAARADAEVDAGNLGVALPDTDAVGVDPKRVSQIEDEYIAEGVEPAVARAEAIAQATEEAYADWVFSQQKARVEAAQGEQDVRQPVTPAGGESVSVAGEPSAGPSAEGVRVTEPAGVVPTAEDVRVPVAGEEGKPGAVEETLAPTPAPAPAPAAVAPKEAGIKSDKFATVPAAERLYRASTAQTKYPGKFWTSIADYAKRYLTKGADREVRTLEETTEFPTRTLNVTELSAAPQAERDAILADLQAWLNKYAPDTPIEDTQLYEVLTGETTDFAFPQRSDVNYLKSKGYDSLFFAKEGGEDVNTWFVFDKRKRATKEEMAARPKIERAMAKRGRKALEPEDKVEVEASNKEKRARKNRNDTKLRQANTLLQRVKNLGPIDGKGVRDDALHMIYDVYATAPYTPQKNQASELLRAQGVTAAERDALRDTHEAWKAKQEQRQQTEAEKKAQATARREAEKAEREAKRAAREAAPAEEKKAPGKPGRPKLSEEEVARREEEKAQKAEARKKAQAEREAVRAKEIEIARQDKEKREAKKAEREAKKAKPSGKKFLSSDYVYHAVRSDRDIAGIIANGLNRGTNVSLYDPNLEGQAFEGEGDTILVFKKEDVAPQMKEYQNDGMATRRAKPVAIFKDTGLEAGQQTVDELESQAATAYEEYQRLFEYIVREYNLNEETKSAVESFALLGSKYAERPSLPKEADKDLTRLRDLQRTADTLLKQAERAPDKTTSEAEILERYAAYGLPVYGIAIDFDKDLGERITFSLEKVSTAKPVAPTAEPAPKEQSAKEQYEREAVRAKEIEIARQDKEKREAKKVKDSTIYLAEILSDGGVGRLFTAFVDADSIKNLVARGDKLDRATENVEQNAIEVAIRGLTPPLAEGAQIRDVSKEQYKAYEELKRELEKAKPVAPTAEPAPKEQSAKEQYADVTKGVAGTPEFDSLPDAVKEQITDLAKRGELNLAAISRIVGAAQSPLPQIRGVPQPANPAFKKFTTAAQAASYLYRTGNFFQKLLAFRLLSTVKKRGTKFVVVEEGDATPAVFSKFPNSVTWASASGVFVPRENTIYVRGESFGDKNGVNNVTVLHELLHAATADRISLGRYILLTRGEATESAKNARDLALLMEKAGEHYRALEKAGELPANLRTLVESLVTKNKDTDKFEYTLFTNLDEFLAYGMSHPTFQNFLKDAPGIAPKQTVFSQFVELIRRIFGIPKGQSSALLSLADVTDRLIGEPMALTIAPTKKAGLLAMKTEPTVVQAAQQNPPDTAPAAAETQKKAKAQSKKVNKTLQKVLRSHSSSPTAMDGIKELVNDRAEAKGILLDSLIAGYKAFKGGSLRQLLPTLQTETVVDWAGRLGLGNVVQAWGLMKDMDAAQVRSLTADAEITERMVKLQLNNPIMYRALSAVMHYSTLREIDPSTEEGRKKAPALAKLWFRLNPEAKQLYVQVRDAYVAKYDQHFQQLSDLINSYPIEGNEADASTPKGNLIASIRKMQETGRGIKPYFPLMRYGNFWVRTGKGSNRAFYMFESQHEKEMFIQRWLREQKVTDPSVKLETLYSDGLISDGNSIKSAREDMGNTSTLLKRMFDNIDNMKVRQVTDEFGDDLPQYAQVTKEQLKDDIYQLVLHTLPDASFRKQFIHRQGTEGFSEDIARNFATLSTAMGRQLARLQYAPKIANSLAAAQSALKGNPDAAKLGEFVKEMQLRAQLQLDPAPENAVGNTLANFANQTAFLYMMTNVKTAVAQVFALPTFTAPVLASNYGAVNTARVMGSFAAIWNSLGVRETAPDGTVSWVAPTIAQSKNVKLNPEERRAAQYMIDRGLSDTTLAYDLGNRKKLPTAVQNSTTRRAVRSTVNFMGALFHHTERLIREVTFMSAFRLAREQNPNASFEEIALQAEKDTYTALNNYSSINRPRGVKADAEGRVMLDAHKPLGRAILQFKMFPAFVTTYFVRNFYRMVGPEYSKAERKQAFTQFFGTLTMSMSIAGVMGIPGFSFVMGVLSGLRNMTMEDDEDDPLEKRNLEFWFRNVWMQETFGDVKVGDKSLADVLDRGAIAALTGFDITSSLSMNNMWFPEMKETATAEAAMSDHALSLMGPFASLAVKQVPKAIDYFNQGKVVQGVEQLLPAMARSPVTAYRYATEGATTTWGGDIKSDDEYKIGHIIGQGLGFGTEGLVARREDLFKAQSLVMKVKNEKRKLIDRLDLEYRGDSGDVDTAIDKIIKFNAKNPFAAIQAEELSDSLIRRIKRRAQAERGADVRDEYYPQLQRLLEPSRRKLEEEAK